MANKDAFRTLAVGPGVRIQDDPGAKNGRYLLQAQRTKGGRYKDVTQSDDLAAICRTQCCADAQAAELLHQAAAADEKKTPAKPSE